MGGDAHRHNSVPQLGEATDGVTGVCGGGGWWAQGQGPRVQRVGPVGAEGRASRCRRRGRRGQAAGWPQGHPSPFLSLLPLTHLQSVTPPFCTPLTCAHLVVTGPASRPGVTVSRTYSTHLSRAESPGGPVPHSLAVSLAVGEGREASLLVPRTPPSAWCPRPLPPGLPSLCAHTPAGHPLRPELLLGEGADAGAPPPHLGDQTTECLLTPPWGQGLERHSWRNGSGIELRSEFSVAPTLSPS